MPGHESSRLGAIATGGTRVLNEQLKINSLDYDHDVAHPLMSQLPPVLYIPAGMPGDDGSVAATLRLLALELGGRPPGSRAAVGRLIVKRHADPRDASVAAHAGGRRDRRVAARAARPSGRPGDERHHERPGEPWTMELLAREVSVSRATLARRFAHLVGETPPEYLTRSRMDLAGQRLRDTDDTVAAIAAAVGYRSEYSFSRAFKRHRGLAPWPVSAPRPRSGARGRNVTHELPNHTEASPPRRIADRRAGAGDQGAYPRSTTSRSIGHKDLAREQFGGLGKRAVAVVAWPEVSEHGRWGRAAAAASAASRDVMFIARSSGGPGAPACWYRSGASTMKRSALRPISGQCSGRVPCRRYRQR